MTGMWGGRGDNDEDVGKEDVEVGGGTGHGDILACTGSSGGGEERVGDLLAEAAGAVVVTDPSCFSSCSCSVSMTMGSGAAALSAW